MPTAIWWIRRDLRLNDNPALVAALERADAVIPLFILDPHFPAVSSPKRHAYLMNCLRSLDSDLRKCGSSLVLRCGDLQTELARLFSESGAGCILAEADISPYALRRDRSVASALPLTPVNGLTIHPPGAVGKSDVSPYVVFTPFSRAWRALPHPGRSLPAPLRLPPHLPMQTELFPKNNPIAGFPADEAGARVQLEEFLKERIGGYGSQRDRLDLEGTSRLSPCLRFGLLSALDAYAQAADLLHETTDHSSVSTWLNELIWREFYYSIMTIFPRVLRGSFRENLRQIPSRDHPAEIKAWQDGLTGYPVVDACMRQLAQTGWMHNRARMITAAFLTKDLLVNWQIGEAWFMRNLIDGDPASNNGG